MKTSQGVLGFLTMILACSPWASADEPPALREPSPQAEAAPYYPHKNYPRLITPQWVGEPGVEAVVVLAIDDMSDPQKYETYLRPILDRLKAIDGRSPVSIMTNRVDPQDARLQGWLKEGLSLEIHTIEHPCPFFHDGDFESARRNYHDCVDLMARVPNSKPIAFRMPCCDSLNTPGPRFYAELFNKTSPNGNFLTIDSSVFNIMTPDDESLPRELVLEPDGKERFRKYLPFTSFVNTIENYPYPYVIGGHCWEFPCIVPSDWEGHNLFKGTSPKTLEDLKAALDLVVLKQGVFNLVFHPYGWIKNDQVVDLIDHAVRTHGGKVKFLNFHEAQARLDEHLLGGTPLRDAKGEANGIELIDLNRDGYLDVVHTRGGQTNARVWSPELRAWQTASGPIDLKASQEHPLPSTDPAALPPHARLLDDQGRDAGLRFVDLDEDGRLDVVFSNDDHYGVFLFDPATKQWSRRVIAGRAGEPNALPKIVKNGTNNGFFVHSKSLIWQNEDTDKLPSLIDRRPFRDLASARSAQ